MTPHVAAPFADLVIAAILGVVAGIAAMAVVLLVAGVSRRRLNRVAVIAGAVIAITTPVIVIQTRALDNLFGGYLSFKSPRERLQDHFADFDERVAANPEISRALRGVPDPSMKLRELRTLGVARLDDATLRLRAQLLSILLSQVSDHACACIVRGSRALPSDKEEIEQAMLRLESTFVAAWMQTLHEAMLAEARGSPVDSVTKEEVIAAYRALEAKIGGTDSERLSEGLAEGASDADRCWVAKVIYAVAPTLPEPHATVLLRDFR